MDSVNECVIEWLKGEKTATVTMPTNTRLKHKILELAEKHSVVSVLQNKDGSILAHIPVEWVNIKPPKKLTEAQREQAIQNLKRKN